MNCALLDSVVPRYLRLRLHCLRGSAGLKPPNMISIRRSTKPRGTLTIKLFCYTNGSPGTLALI